MGQSSAVPPQPRQVNAPVMRVGQSPEACEQAAPASPTLTITSWLLANEANLQLADYGQLRKTCFQPTTGSWCASVCNTPLILETKDYEKG